MSGHDPVGTDPLGWHPDAVGTGVERVRCGAQGWGRVIGQLVQNLFDVPKAGVKIAGPLGGRWQRGTT